MGSLQTEVAAALKLARACDDLTTRLLDAGTKSEEAALRAKALDTFAELHHCLDAAFQSISNQIDRLERDNVDR